MPRFARQYAIRREVPLLVIVPEGSPPPGGHRVTLALHGMGESGESFAEVLKSAISRQDRAWIIPTAPHAFEKRRDRSIGHAWYLFAGDQEVLRASMNESSSWLKDMLALLERDENLRGCLNFTSIDVLGFSQGGYLASIAWLAIPSIARVVCVGGRLKQEWWPDRTVHSSQMPARFLHLHGADDLSVAPEMAMAAARAAIERGFEVDARLCKGVGHEVSGEMLEAYMAWSAS